MFAFFFLQFKYCKIAVTLSNKVAFFLLLLNVPYLPQDTKLSGSSVAAPGPILDTVVTLEKVSESAMHFSAICTAKETSGGL